MAAAGAALALPVADDVGDGEHGLLAVADDGGVDEVGDRLGVERRVPAGDDERVAVVAVGGVQRDAGEVERGQHVRVAELGGERQPEQVEVADRAVRVDGELRDAVLAHERLEVRPHGIRALREGVGPLVEDFVEDHDALVGHAHLVGVGVHQGPADGAVPGDLPGLDGRVQLTADVLDRLAHLLEERLQGAED